MQYAVAVKSHIHNIDWSSVSEPGVVKMSRDIPVQRRYTTKNLVHDTLNGVWLKAQSHRVASFPFIQGIVKALQNVCSFPSFRSKHCPRPTFKCQILDDVPIRLAERLLGA